jgi:amidase
MPTDTELYFAPARKLAQMIRSRKLSVTELTLAFIAQIERVNPKVNAIVTFLPEEALKAAKAMDRKKGRQGILAGLPIAFKDLVPTKDVRTTFGSRVFEHNVPQEDHALVERLRAEGAILVGKTNTPEFGAGSQTFNKVFGATLNPYDLDKTCGGSSPTDPTSPRACAILATTATSSASGPLLGAYQRGLLPTHGTRSPCWGRWRAPFPTAPCYSVQWPARIRARRPRSTNRAGLSLGRCREISGKFASPGAAISGDCRWTLA